MRRADRVAGFCLHDTRREDAGGACVISGETPSFSTFVMTVENKSLFSFVFHKNSVTFAERAKHNNTFRYNDEFSKDY